MKRAFTPLHGWAFFNPEYPSFPCKPQPGTTNQSETGYEVLKNQSLEDQARFIFSENDKLDVPHSVDVFSIEAALDVDYATIKRVG